MNEFSHLENNLCDGKGFFPHFMLSIEPVEKGFYEIEAYTHSYDNLIKFKAKKNKIEMEKFYIMKDVRDYELFIKRAFGE